MASALRLVTLVAGAITIGGSVLGMEFEFFQPVDPPRRCQAMAHRGQAHQAPENTAPAIAHAIEDLLEWVEVDVRRSKDGQHVLLHDNTVDRTTNGHGAVRDLMLAELKQLDAGSWFAPRFAGTRLLTLPECLALAKGKINLYLDGKDLDVELLVREVRAAGMERQVVVFDRPETLLKVREVSGGSIAVMPKWRPGHELERLIERLRPAIVEIDADEATPELCERLHQQGIKVQAKTLGRWDVPEFWRRVLAAKVDYVQTDLPEEFLACELFERVKRRPVQFSLHRGAKRYAPENTLPAFEKSARLGADYVEFDVRVTADGQAFLLHDGTLDRTTNGQGPIANATSDEIRRLDAGGWFSQEFAGTPVPTLDQFLAVGGPYRLYFDAKALPAALLAASLKERGLVAATVVFGGPSYLLELERIEPALARMPPLYQAASLDKLAKRVKPYAVDARWEDVSPELIANCHERGIKVFSDAIGDTDRWDEHLRAIEAGIDLIQTDEPLQLIRAIELYAARHGAKE